MERQFMTLNINSEGHTSIVTLNSPPVNTITSQFIDDLELAFQDLAKKDDLRAVILTSGLEKVFVSGADIRQFVHAGAVENAAIATRGHKVFDMIENFPHPVICAINGIAFGGGLEMALACDIRVMDKRAKVGLPEAGLGIIPGYGGTQRLTRQVGAGAARRLLYTGMAVDAEEALRIGLAEIIAEPGECLAEAKKLASQICEKAPLAVTADKKCVQFALEHPLAEGLFFEVARGGEVFGSSDKTEGMTAFLEKRKPNFRNQ